MAAAPTFVRNELVQLESINVTSANTGHREKDDEQTDNLESRFADGEFGRSVACGVQLLEDEEGGQRLIDDGLSCVSALLKSKEAWTNNKQASPSGETWTPEIVSVFTTGLQFRSEW